MMRRLLYNKQEVYLKDNGYHHHKSLQPMTFNDFKGAFNGSVVLHMAVIPSV